MAPWLLKLIGSIGSSVFGAGFGSLFRRVENASLTGKEREQNQFNADQAALQRDFAQSEREAAQSFNAEQAQNQMNFQERMANTQYQRSVSDMKAAGINPAFAVGGISGASTAGAMATSSPASGAAASGSSSPVGLSEVMQAARLKKDLELADAEIADKQSDANYKNAAAASQGASADLTRKQVLAFDAMNQAQLDNLLDNLKNNEVQRRLNEANISETEARKELEANNAILAQIDSKYRDQLNSLNMRLRIAEIGESYKRMEKINAEINELYQRAILEAAQSNLFDQQTTNLLVEQGILELDKQTKQFSVDHQQADRNWRIAGQVISSVVGVAGAAAGMMTGAGVLGRTAALAGSAAQGAAQSALYVPSRAVSPGSYDAFQQYVNATRR